MIKIFSSLLFFLLLILIMGFRLFPDENILEKIKARFSQYNVQDQEKIYLHLDKPFYSGGETIWYKMYLVNSQSNAPSTLSKLAYVDLVDHKNILVKRQRLQIREGVASGDIFLEENLDQGNYKIVAYTNYMRNLNQDLWFKKDIILYKPGAENPEVSIAPAELDKIYFFPEGGYLVNGLESKVAFKAVDKRGFGLQVSGYISNSNGDTISTFSSSELGLGSFELKPENSENYVAKVLITDTIYNEFSLPEPLSQGLVMKVISSSAENLSVQISGNTSSDNNSIILLAQSKGKIYFQTSTSFPATGNTNLSIPKHSLPGGVNQITLFSSSGEPVAERLVFIDHQNQLKININSDKPSYLPREKITLQLQVNDKNGNPLATNLSMAVTNSQIFGKESSEDNILSYLNLSSEVKGEIENPGWYFGGNNSEALDALLLTQGWRRFTWDEILNGKVPETNFYVEDELALKGRVKDKSTGKFALGSSVTMTISGENPQYLFDLTDDKGVFVFHELDLSGPQTFYLKAIEKYATNEGLEIFIDSIPAPSYKFNTTNNFNGQKLNDAYKNFIQKKIIIKESFEYFLTAEDENSSLASPSSKNISKKSLEVNYHADEIIDMENYLSFSNMEDVIRELVRGVIIRKKGDQYRLRVLDSVTKYYFKKEPVYLIDGIPVDNANEIMNLDPSIVKLITVSKPPDNFYDFGIMGEAGVLAFYTSEMNRNLEKSTKALKVNFKGYDRSREFYAPDHGNKSLPSNIPDFRQLLYWNSSITTDNEGKATVSFYASDDVTNWQVIVEGLSDSGMPGVGQSTFKTKFPQN